MTASRVFNPKHNHLVAPRTRERIMEVAQQMNYRPSGLIRALKTGKTYMIGFIGYDLSNQFLGNILIGLQDELYPKGYVFEGDRLLESIVDRRIDGVVITQSQENPRYDYLLDLQQHGVPVVAVDREIPLGNIAFVGSDDFGGAKLATEHLIELGHHKIAFLVYDHHTYFSSTKRRIEGYREAMINAGLKALPEIVIPRGSGDLNSHRETIQRMLDVSDRPTAIFANNDYTAGDALAACWEMGLRLPQDMSVVGFTDDRIAERLHPPLTTVHQDPQRIGRQAGMVLEKLMGIPKEERQNLNRIEAQKHSVPTYLVKRMSAAALKK